MANVALRVELPQELVTEYETRGDPVKELVRVAKLYRHRTDLKPVIVGDSDRRRIESVIGRNISTADEIVNAFERMNRMNVDGAEVVMSKMQLDRLRFLFTASGKKDESEFPSFVAAKVKEAVYRFLMVK